MVVGEMKMQKLMRPCGVKQLKNYFARHDLLIDKEYIEIHLRNFIEIVIRTNDKYNNNFTTLS